MAKDHIVIDPVEELLVSRSLPFESTRAMPPSVYTSEKFLEQELEHIFSKDWFCLGRIDGLANAGDYMTCELAGQPIVVIRDQNGVLRAISNVCLHRMSTLLKGRGNARSVVCPYHAWTYSLNGTLRGAPAMGLNEGFCKDQYKLLQVRCQEWLGWVFVSLNADAPNVYYQLQAVEEIIGGYDLANYSESFYEEHVWDTNWKVLAEKSMESYHLPVCHGGTIGGLSKLEDMICPPGLPAFVYHTMFKDEELRIAMAHALNIRLKGKERRTPYLLAIYPSLMVTLPLGYFWYISLHPKGPGQVYFRFGGGMSNDFKDDAGSPENFSALKTLWDEVNVEDRGCTEKVYKGLCSHATKPGHLSHLERPNYDFAQYLMAQINVAKAD